ncbi:DUF2169 family type VI secretion system accessory protein [Chondromyces apiculatus]|uniref:DUF2169 domain-containing protein n=1 Tax=Chondromyces apiculatus DSM 436 TaxID=1192034 RepID=A0A017SW54_9BACT|nr:DUF2169 domain-containing protein [Chondromyces apiculatus]EYF01218.1 Hypothetical protein CAP_8559 [Chondromyces apiculatus DSM 436]
MHLTSSAAALRVASRIWPTARGGWNLTLVCKATYRLQPGESPVHDTPEPVFEDDTHWNDDPTRSLAIASDLAPFKPRADVVLVGSAHAPRGVPAASIVVRLVVSDLDKSLEAFAPRAWTQDGQLREGPRVTKVSLRYERAAGGPGSWNPVGVRADAPPDAHGQVPLPSLQPVGLHVTCREDTMDPIGFGPIAPTWPSRRDRLGRHAGTWPHDRWWEQSLPEGFDPGFFNVAPRDQQIAELHDNARLVLEHLHPDHPRLVTSLPGLRPRASAARPGRLAEEIPLRCDTLWIDTDRGLCTLVWRGRLSLSHPEEAGRIVVTAEGTGASPASSRAEPSSGTRVPAAPPSQPRQPVDPEGTLSPGLDAVLTLDLEEDDDAGRTLSLAARAAQRLAALPFLDDLPEDGRATLPMMPAPPAGQPAPSSDPRSAFQPRVDTGTLVQLDPASPVPGPGSATAPASQPRVDTGTLMHLESPLRAATPGSAALPFAQEPPPRAATPGSTALPFAQEPPPRAATPSNIALPFAVPWTPPASPTAPLTVTDRGAVDPPPESALPPDVTEEFPAFSVPLAAAPPMPFRTAASAAPSWGTPADAAPPTATPSRAALPFVATPATSSPAAAPRPEAAPLFTPAAAPPPPLSAAAPPPPPPYAVAPPPLVSAAASTDAPSSGLREPRLHLSPEPAPKPAPKPALERQPPEGQAPPGTEAAPPPAEAPASRTPADVPLERCAEISASLACRPAERATILKEHDLAPETWATVERRWVEAIRGETAQGKQALLKRFDAAYLERLEKERGPILPVEYARITVALERGQVDQVLVDLRIPKTALMRVERVWLRRMAAEPALDDGVREAVAAQREL